MGSSNKKLSAKSEPYSFQAREITVFVKESPITYMDKATKVPKGRSGHRIIVDDTFMYTFGGYNPMLDQYLENLTEGNDDADNYRLFKEIWKFNFVTKEWNLLNIAKDSFPNELASTVVEMAANTMIVHGGTGIPFGVSSSRSTYGLNIKQGNRLVLFNTVGTLPAPMYGQGSFLDEKQMKLYVVGGTSGLEFFMDVHCLDLNDLSWSILETTQRDKPDGRYRHEIAVYGYKILVFGGGTIDHAFDFQALPAFDLRTNRWGVFWTKGYRSAMAPPKYPAARRCHGGILVPGDDVRDTEYIICGGFNGRRAFSDIWSLNLRTRQWYKWNTSFPHSLYFHACALTPEGKLFVFGGVKSSEETAPDFEYPDRTNQILACWVKIPKLAEIAWEAVLHYTPYLPWYPPAKLLNIGIPRKFVDRIAPSEIVT